MADRRCALGNSALLDAGSKPFRDPVERQSSACHLDGEIGKRGIEWLMLVPGLEIVAALPDQEVRQQYGGPLVAVHEAMVVHDGVEQRRCLRSNRSVIA